MVGKKTNTLNKLDWILCYEVVWGWGWAMDQWKLCYMEIETGQHLIHVINSRSIHMWDILNITVFWEI